MTTGRIVILSGPSGVGKDTVIDAWRAVNPRVMRVVAYTTRSPRAGETHGVDYHFSSREDFDRRAAAGEFLEYKEVHGNGYATPLLDLERMLAEGKIAILKIDVQGALNAMTLRPDALTVFLMPPSLDELERRIHGRATDSPEAIATRLKNAQDELAMAPRYQHQSVNLNVDQTVQALEALLAA